MKNGKNDTRTPFERPKSDKMKVVKMQKCQETAGKVTVFDLQNINSRPFVRYLLYFAYMYMKQCPLHIFRFRKVRKFSLTNLKTLLYRWFYPIFYFSQNLKIPDSDLIETLILNSVENQSLLSLKLAWRFPQTLIFKSNRETWCHSDVIYGRLIGARRFTLSQHVSDWWKGGLWKFGDVFL